MTQKPTLLVTGASGHLGRRVIELLLEADAGPIIAVTRNPEKLSDLAKRGIEVRKADFDEPATLAKAFAGADRLLLISTDQVGRPGGRHSQHRAAIDAAVTAGVKHVVYTSGWAPRPSIDDGIRDDHFWTEQALAASPLGWTVLRNELYAENLLLALPNAIAFGQLASATRGGGRNYVTREDCARTAVGALLSGFDGRRILDVTGPAPVTQAEVAAIASELTGRLVKPIDITPEELKKGLLAVGIPAGYATALVNVDLDAAQGYQGIVTGVVKELSGKEPTSVREFLVAHRDALRKAAA